MVDLVFFVLNFWVEQLGVQMQTQAVAYYYFPH